MYSGDGLVFDYQMALPQTDHASHNFKSVRCFERRSIIHSIIICTADNCHCDNHLAKHHVAARIIILMLPLQFFQSSLSMRNIHILGKL